MPKKQGRKSQDSSSFDPSQLNDEIALQTEWSPLSKGGTSFQTHQLVTVNEDRLEFQATKKVKRFYGKFILFGLFMMPIALIAKSSSGESIFYLRLIVVVFGFVIAIVTGYVMLVACTPRVFDKQKGMFWMDRKGPDEILNHTKFKSIEEFENVHALQLIAEGCSVDGDSFSSYELNLVLKDGKRINLVDHGDAIIIREDAKTLSEFLDKPLWDAIG